MTTVEEYQRLIERATAGYSLVPDLTDGMNIGEYPYLIEMREGLKPGVYTNGLLINPLDVGNYKEILNYALLVAQANALVALGKEPCQVCVSRAKVCFFRDPGPCPVCGGKYRSFGMVNREVDKTIKSIIRFKDATEKLFKKGSVEDALQQAQKNRGMDAPTDKELYDSKQKTEGGSWRDRPPLL